MRSEVPPSCTKFECCRIRCLMRSGVSLEVSRISIASADAISSSEIRPSSTSAMRISTRTAISPLMSSVCSTCSSAATDEPTAVRSIRMGTSCNPYVSSFIMIAIIASTASRVCMSSHPSGQSTDAARKKLTHPTESCVFSSVSSFDDRVSRPVLRTRMSSAMWIVAEWNRRKCAPSSPSSRASLDMIEKACLKISSVRPRDRFSQSATMLTMFATSGACRLSSGISSRHSITSTLRSSSGTSSAAKSTCGERGVGAPW